MKPKRIVINGKQECIGCHQWLDLELFGAHKASSTGRNWRCKECHKKTSFGGKTPAQRAKEWQVNNPERYAQLNEESRNRILHDADRLEARRKSANDCYHKHRETHIASHRAWRQNNPWAAISDKSRSLIRMTVKGMLSGGPRFKFLTGLEGDQFRNHLQSLWKPGMGWHNFGREGWTIGHIKACSTWKDALLTDKGLQECFHYSTLQPEWGHENTCKNTKEGLTAAQAQLLKVPLC